MTESSAKKVFIDPGHGGDDNGAAWGEKWDYLEEDDLSLGISFLLRYELQLAGFDVALSRERDEAVSLRSRAMQANLWNAEAFVSVHADAWHNKTASGISTHIHPKCGENALILAEYVQGELTRRFWKHINRSIRKSDFQVLRETRMPAILVECEFISNPDTRRFLKEPENQLDLAACIAQGVKAYFGLERFKEERR